MLKSLLLVCALILTCNPGSAQETYDYPYKNADIATLSSFIMKSRNADSFSKMKMMEVEAIPGRNGAFLFEGRGNYRFGFYPQKKNAPLVFLIADIGGSAVSGYMMYEADLLQENGYNVITISSSFFWNYVISASRTGLPGVTDEDAADMYAAMQLALAKVKTEHKHAIGKIGVIGLGLGGLHAAHISAIEGREKKLSIERYLLINPIVNVLHAITEIETRASIAFDIGMPKVEYIKGKAFNFVYDLMDEKFDAKSPAFFADLDKKFVLPLKEYSFLIGGVLRTSIDDVIFASQIVKDAGVLKSKLDRHHWNVRHQEISEFGFKGYLEKLVIPHFAGKYPKLTDMIKHVNFNYVRKEVLENNKVFLMHNADDFLVDADHLTYLQELFGPARSKIYPLGGHLGNLWFEQNQNDMLRIMSAIK